MCYQEKYNTVENFRGISAGTEEFLEVSWPGLNSF